MAIYEVSTAKITGESESYSNGFKAGEFSTASRKSPIALFCSSDHSHGISFLVNFTKWCALCTKFLIKILRTPTVPKKDLTLDLFAHTVQSCYVPFHSLDSDLFPIISNSRFRFPYFIIRDYPRIFLVCHFLLLSYLTCLPRSPDRKSTRLNSSHSS